MKKKQVCCNKFLFIFIFLDLFLCNIGYELIEPPLESRLGVIVYGAFVDENSNTTNFLYIRVQLLHEDEDDGNYSISYIENDDNIFRVPITGNIKDIDTATEVKKAHTFYLDEEMFDKIPQNDTVLRLSIQSNLPVSLPINLAYDPTPIDKSRGVIYAAIVLFGLYVMIIWEVVHRTFGEYHFNTFSSAFCFCGSELKTIFIYHQIAAIIASTTAIAILALMNERPTMPEIMSWIDVETLLLLFGMMILVAILSETGIFDYLAVYAFKVF